MAFSAEAGSATQERLFDRALEIFSEGVEHNETAWNVLNGRVGAAQIEQIVNQPESVRFVGSENRVREFSLGGTSGIQVTGTHRGDSNFIGRMSNTNG